VERGRKGRMLERGREGRILLGREEERGG